MGLPRKFWSYPLIPLSRRLVLWGGIGVTVRARGSQAGRGAVAWIIIVVLVIALAGRGDGAFVKVWFKGVIWYNPKTVGAAVDSVASTWEEVLAITDRIAAAGKAAWCIVLASGAASGWPATDWGEHIVLRPGGPA